MSKTETEETDSMNRATETMEAEAADFDAWCEANPETPDSWGDRRTDDVGYGYRR